MKLVATLLMVAYITGCDDVQSYRIGNGRQRSHAVAISSNGIALQLYKKSILAKHGTASTGKTPCCGKPSLRKDSRQQSLTVSGENDQTLLTRFERVEVEARVETVFSPQMGFSNEPTEVGISLCSFRQQRHARVVQQR